MSNAFTRLFLQEDLNFLLTNRIPRALVTQLVGWLAKVENPLLRVPSIAAWRFFGDVDLSDAAKTEFKSLGDCFIRALKPGSREVDPRPEIFASPCDTIVGACGQVQGNQLIQAKGCPYTLEDLLVDPELVQRYQGATWLTLRLTSDMYHRFHAPYDLRVSRVDYISGDTWNTNPIALKRVEKLFAKNERAVVRCAVQREGDAAAHELLLVPVASILVASIKLHCLPVLLRINHRGPTRFDCDARFTKGQEMGWFELGSTILVFAPPGYSLCPGVEAGVVMRQGQPLLRLPASR